MHRMTQIEMYAQRIEARERVHREETLARLRKTRDRLAEHYHKVGPNTRMVGLSCQEIRELVEVLDEHIERQKEDTE